MRPEILFPLFKNIETLPGVGSRNMRLFHKLIGEKVVDCLWHLPNSINDRTYMPKIADAISGKVATLRVTPREHRAGASAKAPKKVICDDDTGEIELVFFRAQLPYLEKILPAGTERIVSGKVERYAATLQMVHPDHILPPEEWTPNHAIEPVYGLTAGLSNKVVRKVIAAALADMPTLPEWIDSSILQKFQWPDWQTAIHACHFPEDGTMLSSFAPHHKRLAFDELLATQLALAIIRQKHKNVPGRAYIGDNHLKAQVLAALPFDLTGAQTRALQDIYKDQADPIRMLRLLQGDVGAGKTMVALFTMLNAIEAGVQTVMMAPTEILARQHYETLSPYFEKIGLTCALLTGRDKGKARLRILEQLKNGTISALIGTHAIFQEDVVYNDLGLAIIDEQHRFGVDQRARLTSKGKAVDVLAMTATPIPRTLSMTHYGDMDHSILDEKPAGRKPIKTVAMPLNRTQDILSSLKRTLDKGEKIYWVCPLVEENESIDLAAAEARANTLADYFGADKVGLVHGKMKAAQKDAVMEQFADPKGDCAILVATTVIEVGVNVPEATVMIIEHAERFGLAQLHQLRGRIGRGSAASSCVLLYQHPAGETAMARLKVMRETEDGFLIAEEDMRLRGTGEILGTRQSGLPSFKIADLAVHGDIMELARQHAELILNRDPDLQSTTGQALRVLLYLHQRDAAAKSLRGG